MIRTIPSIVACLSLLLFAAPVAEGQTKVDPFLQASSPASATAFGLKATASGAAAEATRLASPEGRVLSDVFIKTSDPETTRAAVEAEGGFTHAVVGDILIARIPPERAEAISEGSEVLYIEADKPVQLKNDLAIEKLHGGQAIGKSAGLPATTGQGVIVGLVDTGIDYQHPDFRNAEGKSRILAIWDQNRDEGPTPSEIDNSFGTECARDSIDNGSCPLRDLDGHGTHIAGTLAGRHETYGGVAPDANIIAVVYDSSIALESGYAETVFSTKICQAAYYIFAKAGEFGMPAVVNLSLGTHIGAHDGSSLFEECLAGLLQDSAGRAIVAAAGNEFSTDGTFTGIHAGYEVSGSNATTFVIRQISRDRIYYIDIWGTPGSRLSFGLALRGGIPPAERLEATALVAPGGEASGTMLDRQIEWMINATETASLLNGKPHVGIRLLLRNELEGINQYSFDLLAKGKGSFDAWLFPDKPSKTIQFTSFAGKQGEAETFMPGDRVKSVAIPATSPAVIAVGAYTSRNEWESALVPNCCQISFPLGELIDFSSSGPTAAPEATGHKPEITAPGAMIASTLSQDARFDNALLVGDQQHVLQAGTSMGTPFVSGTVALMFSVNPNFTHEDARRFIVESAVVDEYVEGEIPHERWGYGKLDIRASLELALNGKASGDFSVNDNDPASPPGSENSGHSGCALVPTADWSGTAAAWPMLTAALLLLLRHRSRFETGPGAAPLN